MKEHAIFIHGYGDTSVLKYTEFELSFPAMHEVQIRHSYSGVNFADIYFCNGLYKLPAMPGILGIEGVGVIEALGEGVTTFKKNQRIAYAGLPTGSYASARNLSAEKIILLPDDISDKAVSSTMLRGITAHMLLTETYPLKAGDTVFIQAAAGGLGLILIQWIKALGGNVIGTVGNRHKADIAKEHGIDHVILYREEDFVTAVNRFTDGQGVDYVIDGIGGETLAKGLKIVREGGVLASIGQVAEPVDEMKMNELCATHSIKFVRPSVMGFIKDNNNYRIAAEKTLHHLKTGLKVKIDNILPLSQAALAHECLKTGKTSGSLLLDTKN